MASFIMMTLTPITTPKNATSMKSTLRPVSGLGETTGLLIRCSMIVLRRDEVVGRRCDLAEADVGDPEFQRYRLLQTVECRGRYQNPQLGRLVTPQNDHGPIRCDGIVSDNVDRRVDRTVNIDC